MAQQKNDIRSTEKLLAIIRDEDSISAIDDKSKVPAGAAKTKKRHLMPGVTFQKKVTVGVDIGHTNIRLAKVMQSDKACELIDYLDVPLNKPVSLRNPQFLDILKSTMVRFCGNAAHCEIWGAIQSADVEIRCIHIPKLQRKQIANAIFWTFTKKVEFNDNLEILDYEILGDINVGGIKKTEVLTFKAPKKDVADFKAAFREIGFSLKGISIVPFAIQNLFRSRILAIRDKDACCLFIGRDWSRIAIYNKGNLVLSRGIKAGIRSMIEAINLAILQGENQTPMAADATVNGRAPKQTTATIDPRAHQIFVDFIGVPGRPPAAPSDPGILDRPQVFQMILPAMERLVRQVERTFEHYALNFNREGVSRIYISGQVIANAVILDYIGQQLDLPVTPMNPFSDESGFSRQVRKPENISDREGYVPAIGLALSTNAITPNFLYTHEDKQADESVRRNNMYILTICMLLLMVMIGVFSWQQKRLDIKREAIEKLDNKLLAYTPPAEKKILLALFAKTKLKRRALTAITQRYMPMAVVSELSKITPSNIRLLNIEATLGQAGDQSIGEDLNTILLEGVVFGAAKTFETALTSYMLSLKKSPIFRKPNVKNRQIEYYDSQQVMRFSASLEIN